MYIDVAWNYPVRASVFRDSRKKVLLSTTAQWMAGKKNMINLKENKKLYACGA